MRRSSPIRWMWLDAFESLARAERLHRQFFELISSHSLGPVWEPPADVYETENGFCVTVALPGALSETIAADVREGKLRVSAMRPVPRECRTATIHRLEIPYGRFERFITLPPGRYEVEQRTLADGCLTVNLAKARAEQE